MEERFLQQLKKGVLELLVLQTICRGPTYGYELIAQLGSRSGGVFTLREGTLYPILYRLEDDGLIEAVLRIQCSTLRIIQLLIIERRSRHQLHQDKEHQ